MNEFWKNFFKIKNNLNCFLFKFLYSSKTGEIYIQKQNTDGTKENLWKKIYIDISKQNIFKLPIGASEIQLTADDDVSNARLVIFPQYKAV